MKEFNKTQELRKLKIKQNKNTYIKRISIILSCVILVIGVLYFTFAKFESNKSYTLIQGKLGDYSSGDLTIGAVIDGVSSSFPNKGDAFLTNIECKDKNGDVEVEYNKSTWTLTNLTVEDKTKCTFYFTTEVVPSTEFKIGDFVEFTPTLTSYTPTTDSSSPYYTGTSTPGTINPSELTKWVVIRDYEHDGVIEMVSYNVSSNLITFYGSVGYMNCVGALNEIAKQYTNEAFIDTSKIRHMGYLPGSSVERCSNLCSGDTYYQTDVNLVKTALKVRDTETLIALDVNGNVKNHYYLASRLLDSNSIYSYYMVRGINSSGLIKYPDAGYYTDGRHRTGSAAIRPIVTLKDDVHASPSGDGSLDNPWVLVE